MYESSINFIINGQVYYYGIRCIISNLECLGNRAIDSKLSPDDVLRFGTVIYKCKGRK